MAQSKIKATELEFKVLDEGNDFPNILKTFLGFVELERLI